MARAAVRLAAPRGSRESGRESTRRQRNSVGHDLLKDPIHALARHCVGVRSKRPSTCTYRAHKPRKPCAANRRQSASEPAPRRYPEICHRFRQLRDLGIITKSVQGLLEGLI